MPLAKECILHVLKVGSSSQVAYLVDSLLDDLKNTTQWEDQSMTRQQVAVELMVDSGFTDTLIRLTGTSVFSLLEEYLRILVAYQVKGV